MSETAKTNNKKHTFVIKLFKKIFVFSFGYYKNIEDIEDDNIEIDVLKEKFTWK